MVLKASFIALSRRSFLLGFQAFFQSFSGPFVLVEASCNPSFHSSPHSTRHSVQACLLSYHSFVKCLQKPAAAIIRSLSQLLSSRFSRLTCLQKVLTSSRSLPWEAITLARRSLFEEFGYHYQLDYPEFDRIPLFSPSRRSEPFERSPSQYSEPLELPFCESLPQHTLTPTPTPSTPRSEAMDRRPRPTFAICGQFSGTSESATKWLKKFDLEMENYRDTEERFPPGKYLGTLDALLTGDASD